MDIIRLLPDAIANQIAAGEVVQRPASAVKELMENAVDAGATKIQLIIKDAGKALIQVIDNGKGMSTTDARMSLERHATSKIEKAEDLFALRTMGFRGEALASLAAVAQLEMKTRLTDDELGTYLMVEASEVKKQEPIACEKGTSIAIKNLFYNIPARRNFLKSNSVEYRHIVDEFFRLALANPSIHFILINHDDIEFDLPTSKLSQRIVQLFGKSYTSALLPCDAATPYVKITGYTGTPEAARKTRGEQFFFANNRFIRSNYLHHAVQSAYEGLLADGNFPFYVLFIEIDPKNIDVNVHPTKTEIKFDDERAVYGIIQAAVREALGKSNLRPSIDFNDDANLVNKLSQQKDNTIYYEERYNTLTQRNNLENWSKLVEGEWLGRVSQQEETINQQLFAQQETNFTATPTHEFETHTTVFQIANQYVAQTVKNGLMLINQQAAHQRILYERFLQQLKAKSGESQQILFPETLSLPATDFVLVTEMEQELAALGFKFTFFSNNTLAITGTPAGLATGKEKTLLDGLIEQFKWNQSELALPIHENLARSLAKRAGIKAGQKLMPEELRSLIDSLMACKIPQHSPEGELTFFIFDVPKIETYFKR
ncbi:MAG: DNA mismatch repair endonuclease MutL [Flammeovirgaceae bacterium]|nr:DNA mismatch repair endonuclease MutL [Flammeovirgaceae bacterium]